MPLNEQGLEPKAEQLADSLSEAAGGPIAPKVRRADDPDIAAQIDALIEAVGGKLTGPHARFVRELMQTGLKLIPDGRDTGELKLMTTALKEMRYAYRVFGRYKEPHKVTIFGSARTPESHPDYAACVDFSKRMAEAGWMIITGAGMGIMKAGHVGPGRESSFGVAIRLPFETNANPVIHGDDKLIMFRYFFTRKLMFVSQAEAVALFPGGFGTLDEAFETLTLVQTGKSSPMPIVMLEGAGGDYWKTWSVWIQKQLMDRGWISPEDPNIYHIAETPQEAVEHVLRFYRNYHSSRYVRDAFVIRLHRPLKAEDVAAMGVKFASLVKEGTIVQSGPLEGEDDHPHLPRVSFIHNRGKFGMIRALIDHINSLTPVGG